MPAGPRVLSDNTVWVAATAPRMQNELVVPAQPGTRDLDRFAADRTGVARFRLFAGATDAVHGTTNNVPR